MIADCFFRAGGITWHYSLQMPGAGNAICRLLSSLLSSPVAPIVLMTHKIVVTDDVLPVVGGATFMMHNSVYIANASHVTKWRPKAIVKIKSDRSVPDQHFRFERNPRFRCEIRRRTTICYWSIL